MSDAVFVHYIVCPSCKRQLRIGRYGIVSDGPRVLVGQRCCSTVWINLGVTVGELNLGQDENSAQGMGD